MDNKKNKPSLKHMRICTGNLKWDFIIMCQIKMTNLSGDEQGV